MTDKKVTNLSVHKNTILKKRSRDISGVLKQCARVAKERNVQGIVVWMLDGDGGTYQQVVMPEEVPLVVVPDMVARETQLFIDANWPGRHWKPKL